MSLNPPLVPLPMLQLLLACSFGATHLGSMQLLARHALARNSPRPRETLPPLALGRAGGMAPSISHRLANRARWVPLCRRSSSSGQAKLTETPKLQ